MGFLTDLVLDQLGPLLLSDGGLALPVVGAAGSVLGMLLGGWKKYVVIAFGLAGVAIYVLVVKLDAARAETRYAKEIGRLEKELGQVEHKRDLQQVEVKLAGDRLKACATATENNLEQLRQYRRQIAAVGQDRERLVKAAERSARTKERIHEAAKQCSGAPSLPGAAPGVPGPVRLWLDSLCERAGRAPGCAD